ncbi:3-phosphoserine/phosphohydroxythreonine transaminase [Candidatus Woesebacteria bacterium]|nr:3-phosphoserine/phosphohydroxythreonine transaminase [Candidatus Woesebacteria bacterium]
MANTIYNFSAGPAVLPDEVLEIAANEMQDWHGSGMSVMEMSHRSKEFLSIAETAEADLRELLSIPDRYKVLFLQGGASGQFAAIPMNLAQQNDKADYVITGSWGKKAYKEAAKYLDTNIAAQADPFTAVPAQSNWKLSKDARYVHVTPNETIEGVAFPFVPETGSVPLVADLSSTILSEPIDVTQYGVIYAGAQKNIGPAGVTIVIVRDDLLGQSRALTPMVWNWEAKAEAGSMLNTPPCYSWYMCGLVFSWLKQRGGLAKMAEQNTEKAKVLYSAIDSSDFYTNSVTKEARSKMNVPFTLADPELDKIFLGEAKDAGLLTLKGHRSIGGMRASIYNAMPLAGVQSLVNFMKEFEKTHG